MSTDQHRTRARICRVVFLIAIGLSLCLTAVSLVRFHSIVDDAFISFRYLDNWIGGQGLVFNPGERVEGYSNFLWIVLLVVPRLVGLDPETGVIALSLVFLALAFWAIYRTAGRLGDCRWAGGPALILAAGSVPLARWAMSGMETVCFGALLILAAERWATRGRLTSVSAFLLGLATLVRPEGLAYGALAFLVAAISILNAPRTRARKLVAPLATFAVFPVAHLVFRLAYYGSPVPNTYFAKLTGNAPGLISSGLNYCSGFLLEGGWFLILPALLTLWRIAFRSPVAATLWLWAAFGIGFTVRAGGDHFTFHRFLVPIVPLLAALGGAGLAEVSRVVKRCPEGLAATAALALVLAQGAAAWTSPSSRAFDRLVSFRAEHEIVADWLLQRFPEGTLLAVNVAGRIPYRTGFPTIDMLGLNDLYIARSEGVIGTGLGGEIRVGHLKHDGAYVCSREPGVVLLSDGSLHESRSTEEAIMQAALINFPGDREFLQAPKCSGRYKGVAAELSTGKYAVAHVLSPTLEAADHSGPPPRGPEDWFNRGLELMSQARLREAVEAFEQVLALEPGNASATANLGFCHLDLQQYSTAAEIFERAVREHGSRQEMHYGLALTYERMGRAQEAIQAWRRYIALSPGGPWEQSARDHLRYLTGSEK